MHLIDRRHPLSAVLPLLCVPLLVGCAAEPAGWWKVGGPLYNVSGMAYVNEHAERGGERFFVVHDNKNPDEPHVGVVTLRRGKARYTRLRWPAVGAGGEGAGASSPPVDLEAVTSIPDAPHRFLAMESGGRLFHLRHASGTALEVLHVSRLPQVPPGSNLEGFSVEKIDGRLVALWAHRGEGEQPAVLYWGSYDLPGDAITMQGSAEVVVPYPRGATTRHITDLRLDPGGTVWAGAASDPGDDGPFRSAVYAIGTLFDYGGGTYRFHPNPNPTRLWTFDRKVEAIELLPGAGGHVYFGSDDEKQGGWIYRGN